MPRFYDYETVDVFTDTRFAGNPLAVFVDARGLSSLEMQAIAREINYSETTFVLPPQRPAETGADAQLRIFTPTYEVPFAGHPNIGAAIVLALRGNVLGKPVGSRIVFEEAAGVVPVSLRDYRDNDVHDLYASLVVPQSLTIGRTISAVVVAAAAGIDASSIVETTHLPLVISVGLPFVAVELADLSALAKVDPRRGYRELLPVERADAVIFYVRLAEDLKQNVVAGSIRARMISPLDGVGEDPATGSANAALVALLLSRSPETVERLAIDVDQGVEMGRPSRLVVEAVRANGIVTEVSVGGYAVRVMRGRMTV